MIVIFLTRMLSVQSQILSQKMKWFHLWQHASYFVPLVSVLYASVSYRQICANGGQCVLNNASSYTCICAPGWAGPNCRINVNDCVRHWCQNGATCLDEIDGYRWVLESRLSWGHSGPRMSVIVKAVTFTVRFPQAGENSSDSIQY